MGSKPYNLSTHPISSGNRTVCYRQRPHESMSMGHFPEPTVTCPDGKYPVISRSMTITCHYNHPKKSKSLLIW